MAKGENRTDSATIWKKVKQFRLPVPPLRLPPVSPWMSGYAYYCGFLANNVTEVILDVGATSLAQELLKGMAAIPLNPGIIDTDMLRWSFGDTAGEYESATAWAECAVPFLLKLGPKQNEKAPTVV